VYLQADAVIPQAVETERRGGEWSGTFYAKAAICC